MTAAERQRRKVLYQHNREPLPRVRLGETWFNHQIKKI